MTGKLKWYSSIVVAFVALAGSARAEVDRAAVATVVDSFRHNVDSINTIHLVYDVRSKLESDATDVTCNYWQKGGLYAFNRTARSQGSSSSRKSDNFEFFNSPRRVFESPTMNIQIESLEETPRELTIRESAGVEDRLGVANPWLLAGMSVGTSPIFFIDQIANIDSVDGLETIQINGKQLIRLTTRSREGWDYEGEIFFDPSANFVVTKMELSADYTNSFGDYESRYEFIAAGVAEVAPGVYFPKSSTLRTYSVLADGDIREFSHLMTTFSKVAVNEPIDDSTLSFVIPNGTIVADLRDKTAYEMIDGKKLNVRPIDAPPPYAGSSLRYWIVAAGFFGAVLLLARRILARMR